MALDKNIETFAVNVAFFNLKIKIAISLAEKVYIALLSIEKIFKNFLIKYLNLTNVFSKDLVIELPEYLSINKHIINLEKGK